MTDIDLDALQALAKRGKDNPDEYMHVYCEVMDALIDRLRKAEAASKWISVSERLPEKDSQLVVVFDPANEPTIWPAKWDAGNKSFSSNGGWFEVDEITLWLPLPAPAAPDSAESEGEKG